MSANLYDIPLLCVQWKTPDDEQRDCPKHVEFYSKIKKNEKLVHLFGYIIRKIKTVLLGNKVCLVIKLCGLNEKYFWFYIGKHIGMLYIKGFLTRS
jgi:hypothetical protein